MVNLEILEKYGCTQQRLREIFTCKDMESSDWAIKQKFENEIESRVYEGVNWSASTSDPYMAVDLAWDSQAINKTTIPLLLYAQGKISMNQAGEKLSGLGCADDFCERDETGGVKKINLMRLYETSMNLIRSYVTRRVAAQVSRFNNLYPYFKYEARVALIPIILLISWIIYITKF